MSSQRRGPSAKDWRQYDRVLRLRVHAGDPVTYVINRLVGRQSDTELRRRVCERRQMSRMIRNVASRRAGCSPAEVALRLDVQLADANDRVVHPARAALTPAPKARPVVRSGGLSWCLCALYAFECVLPEQALG